MYQSMAAKNELLTKQTPAIMMLKKTQEGKMTDILKPQYSPCNHWAGKKIVWLGTSIATGDYSAGISYPALVCDRLGAQLVNTSLNGQALHMNGRGGYEPASGAAVMTEAEYLALDPAWEDAENPGHLNTEQSFHSFQNSLLGHAADLYVFDTEANNTAESEIDLSAFDFETWQYRDGSNFDVHRNTYAGAVLFMLHQLWSENPLARVVFIGWQGNLTTTLRGLTRRITDQLNLPYIDLWKKMGYVPPLNRALLTDQNDGLHPNLTWVKLMANVLVNELLLIS